MPLGDSYATVAELKARLEIKDTVDDTALTNALAAASRGIEKFCRRQFNIANSVSTRVYEPLDALVTYVDDFWTTTGLVVATDLNGDGIYETTWSSTTDYELYPTNGVVAGESGWPYSKIRAVGFQYFPVPYTTRYWRKTTLQVTANWGWFAVPATVKEVCLAAAEEYFKLKDAPFTPAIRVGANKQLAAMLAPYRRGH